jgi:PKD repeat protein
MKTIKGTYKKAVNTTGVIVISLLLITSVLLVVTPTGFAEQRAPKTIWGYVQKCDGGSANGASVVVSASGYPDETTTVAGGAYQVDVGPDTGTEWPDGTSFTVTCTLSGWSGSNTGTVSGSATQCDVTVDPPTLVASASGTPTTILVGDTVSFTGSATGGTGSYSWYWDFDDGGTSTLQNPTHQFNTQGTFVVELTVTDTCSNTDTDTVTITVNPLLSCDAGGPYSGNICNPVSFSGTASGGIPPYTYSWDFGDGGSGSGQNPTHQYTADGSYTATLTVTDFQSTVETDTASVSISTTALSANAGGPYSGTMCNPVSFSGSASGGCSPYTYSWDFGDGGSGSGQSPSHLYTADGTYTVTLTVTDDVSQTDEDTASVTISTSAVVAEAGGPYDGNEDDPITFYGSASGGCSPYSYSWDFGDGGSGSGQNPSHTYDDPGTYTVTLTITDDVGQTDTDTATCNVEQATVIADAGGPYYGETGVPVQFSGSASEGFPPYSYSWDFGDGGSGTGQNPEYTYSLPNPSGYDVILTVEDSHGNTDSDFAKAYITGEPPEDPIADANGPYTGILNQPVEFTGSAAGGTPPYSYSWNFGDGGTSTDQNPSHTYTTEGVFDVSLTVTDDNGKTDTDTTTATIAEGNADLLCAGSLSWSSVESGAEVSSSFVVSNGGDPGTLLDWEILSYPEWGTWTFAPGSGVGLTPEAGGVTVEVSVVAPTNKARLFSLVLAEETYDGVVEVVNSDDAGDVCEIPVSMVVPRARVSPWLLFISWLIDQYPLLASFFEL